MSSSAAAGPTACRGCAGSTPPSIEELEPHARGIAGLHSPDTGIADFAAVARAYAQDLLDAGATVATGCEVQRRAASTGRALRLGHAQGVTEATHAVFCAGAWADRLAVAAGADPDPRIVPFRGAYLRLVPERRQLVRSLIYPVPDPSLPFLGVHLTKHIGGEVLIGPTALMAGARDAYRARAPCTAATCSTRSPGPAPGGCSPTGGRPASPSCVTRAALRVRARRRALRARAASSSDVRAGVRRRARAGARPRRQAGRRLRLLRTPSARCTCATRPRPPRPPRWRSPATSPTRPSARSRWPKLSRAAARRRLRRPRGRSESAAASSSSRLIFALDERAERIAAATALPPATKRASAAGMRLRRARGRALCGQRHEVVEADRLVVGDVVDRPGARALRAARAQRRCDVLDVHDIPQVLAAADHREAAGLAQMRRSARSRTSRPGPYTCEGRDHDGRQPRARAPGARPPAWSARTGSARAAAPPRSAARP